MRRAFSLLVILAFLGVALAGCTSTYEGPKEFTVPKDAGPTARQADVPDPFELTVRVVSAHNGEPIEGAAVVFFEKITREDGRGFYYSTVIEYDALAAARTEADGTATGLLAPDAVVNVGVGDVEGLTNEIRPQVVLGGPGESATVEVALYHQHVEVTLATSVETRLTNPTAQVGQAEPERVVVPIRFTDDETFDAGFRERLVHLDVRVRWNNTETDYADFFAGLRVANGSTEWWGDDARQQPSEGDLEENLSLDQDALEGARDEYVAGGLEAQALTDEPIVTLDRLPLTLHVEADFYASDLVIRS